MDAQVADGDPGTLGRYRVVGRLGVGDRGEVLLGVDEDGRRAAVRVVPAELAADPHVRERFRHEIRVAAAAPSWVVAPVLDADPDAERPWIANDFVDGPSLHAYVSEAGPLDEFGVAALALRLVDGLAAMHAAGLVHEGISPSTVLLGQDGPRLVDFGISRALREPGHRSPEPAPGECEADAASDMFSFGAVIGFAANGVPPLGVGQADPDLGQLTGRVREIVAGCLQIDPAARPTAVQVRGLLRAEVPPAEPAAPPAPDAATVGVPTVVAAAARERPATLVAHPAPVAVATGMHTPPPVPRRPGAGPRLTPSWLAAAAALGVVAALTAVVLIGMGGGGTIPGRAGAAPLPAGSSRAPGAADPLVGATIIDAGTDRRFGTGSAAFTAPSRNIACDMRTGEVRCDVVQRNWQLPPKPSDCQGDFGTGVSLVGTEQGTLTCASDTVNGPALPVLGYGQGVRLGDVVCVSRESGLTCKDTSTQHGFRLTRGSYDLY